MEGNACVLHQCLGDTLNDLIPSNKTAWDAIDPSW